MKFSTNKMNHIKENYLYQNNYSNMELTRHTKTVSVYIVKDKFVLTVMVNVDHHRLRRSKKLTSLVGHTSEISNPISWYQNQKTSEKTSKNMNVAAPFRPHRFEFLKQPFHQMFWNHATFFRSTLCPNFKTERFHQCFRVFFG